MLVLLLTTQCLKLDDLVLAAVPVQSIDEYMYLHQPIQTPIGSTLPQIEKEIYLSIPDGHILSADNLDSHAEYIHGAFFPAPIDCHTSSCPLSDHNITWVYQHGNYGNIDICVDRILILWRLGTNVFLWDYRGYGLSKGEKSGAHVLEDAEVVIRYLSSRSDLDDSQLIMYGMSMGGVPSSYLAGESALQTELAGCVLEAALDSADSLLQITLGLDYPTEYFSDLASWDAPGFLANTQLPVLHLHGGNDEMLSIELAKNYYHKMKDHESYTHYIGESDKPDETWIRTASHNNIPYFSNYPTLITQWVLHTFSE